MGMAASQARFLGLTARKNNVEYEGQQINQQRTTLGNQSANYYNNLLGMSVPVPPSVQDFTKTVYTFQDGNLNNNITALIAQADGLYKVSYVSSWQNDFAPVSNGAAIIFKDNNTYKIGNVALRNLAGMDIVDDGNIHHEVVFEGKKDDVTHYIDPKDQTDYYVKDDKIYSDEACTTELADWSIHNSQSLKDDPYYKTLTSKEEIQKALDYERDLVNVMKNKFGTDTDWYVRYAYDSTSGVWNPIFYDKHIVEAAQYNKDTGASQSNIPSYKIGSAVETEEVKGVKARLEKDATGRYISITIMPSDDVELTYSLTTNTTTDQAAYNDAMNQYEFDKYTYDQSIQEINAKIEIVQAEDRNLELRLKQLDTEQDAIQTEMDAVQKVIEKNVESTFKTFG